jgi:hypothetical protein
MMYMETLPGTNFCPVAEYMEARVEWRMAYNLYLHGSLVIEMGFAFDDLDFDHTRLEEQNAQLQDRNNTLQLANTHLEVQNAPLQERNNILQAQVDSLQTQLRDLSIRHEKEKENSGRPDLSQLSAHEFYQHFGAVFEQSKKFILPSEGVTPKVPASSATAGQADTTNIPTPSSKLLPTEMYIDTLVQGSSAPFNPDTVTSNHRQRRMSMSTWLAYMRLPLHSRLPLRSHLPWVLRSCQRSSSCPRRHLSSRFIKVTVHFHRTSRLCHRLLVQPTNKQASNLPLGCRPPPLGCSLRCLH